MDGAGDLYGTTLCDGANNAGSVFELTPSGNSWTYTSLHDFTGGNDGRNVSCNLVFDANGNIYGTAANGESQRDGVVWEITPKLDLCGFTAADICDGCQPFPVTRSRSWVV